MTALSVFIWNVILRIYKICRVYYILIHILSITKLRTYCNSEITKFKIYLSKCCKNGIHIFCFDVTYIWDYNMYVLLFLFHIFPFFGRICVFCLFLEYISLLIVGFLLRYLLLDFDIFIFVLWFGKTKYS